jgi:hypothetical protein
MGDREQRIRVAAVLRRRTLDGALVLPIDRAQPLVLDPIAADVLDRCAAPIGVGELADLVAADYRGDAERIVAEVSGVVARLLDEGVLEVVDD